MLLTLARKKGVNIICILADIDGIKDGDSRLLQENIADFKRYKKFIVHNEAMKGWLKMKVQADQIAAIEFFDFLTKEVEGDRQKDGDIVFAGNLGKSLFIEQLHLVTKESPAIRFNLYGDGYANKGYGQPGVHFKGVFKAYDLPARLEGSFGLVWDGDSIHEPGGSLGDYMRFITHHKVSLYIISGLPLIVPEMAASAALVEKYGIGITVPGLFEIAGRVGAVTEDQYRQMRLNLRPLAQKITAGQCLAGALNDLLKNTGKV